MERIGFSIRTSCFDVAISLPVWNVCVTYRKNSLLAEIVINGLCLAQLLYFEGNYPRYCQKKVETIGEYYRPFLLKRRFMGLGFNMMSSATALGLGLSLGLLVSKLGELEKEARFQPLSISMSSAVQTAEAVAPGQAIHAQLEIIQGRPV
ncbi:MAG: hypothetical protein ACREJN_19720, partial [Nitrospiraceae bacterium]